MGGQSQDRLRFVKAIWLDLLGFHWAFSVKKIHHILKSLASTALIQMIYILSYLDIDKVLQIKQSIAHLDQFRGCF